MYSLTVGFSKLVILLLFVVQCGPNHLRVVLVFDGWFYYFYGISTLIVVLMWYFQICKSTLSCEIPGHMKIFEKIIVNRKAVCHINF